VITVIITLSSVSTTVVPWQLSEFPDPLGAMPTALRERAANEGTTREHSATLFGLHHAKKCPHRAADLLPAANAIDLLTSPTPFDLKLPSRRASPPNDDDRWAKPVGSLWLTNPWPLTHNSAPWSDHSERVQSDRHHRKLRPRQRNQSD
jgi:hypothetical protein